MKKNKRSTSIIFYGIGGQGVIKAAEVCGWAALFDGYHVKQSEVHGMAQRGGSVESHLIFGEEVFSPLVPEGEADVIVCFHESEHSRLKHFLKKGGVDLLPYLKLADQCAESKKFSNTFILGVLSKYLDISRESWMKAIERVFASKSLNENIRVFMSGLEQGGRK
ncbi:MAG TPA: indolepyruvate oxidoreductase subunit beta [Candidatus Omnitrophota bacterium]|nr:indolepyruvate oxidoreductase subunit beta [Candidatus Omnitrophota bacterium]HPS20784.1 indolepyruvate oxidoreductase subunit beta [Candidatus Omnitrophota bacterium]